METELARWRGGEKVSSEDQITVEMEKSMVSSMMEGEVDQEVEGGGGGGRWGGGGGMEVEGNGGGRWGGGGWRWKMGRWRWRRKMGR